MTMDRRKVHISLSALLTLLILGHFNYSTVSGALTTSDDNNISTNSVINNGSSIVITTEAALASSWSSVAAASSKNSTTKLTTTSTELPPVTSTEFSSSTSYMHHMYTGLRDKIAGLPETCQGNEVRKIRKTLTQKPQ